MIPARVKRFIPSPIRSLPWRYRWVSGTQAYRVSPLSCVGRLVRWTILELLDRDTDFKTREGYRLRSTSRNFTSLCVYLTGERDPELQAFIAKRLEPGTRFLDIGANIGVYTVFASGLVGESGHVLAVEAYPSTFMQLADNVERNGLRNVTLVQRAAGAENGTVRMTSDRANAGQTCVDPQRQGGIEVVVERVDDLTQRYGIDAVDYMKVDVEGFELSVLKGSMSLISNSPNIVIQTELVSEHARRYGHGVDSIVEFLTGLGLKPFYADERGDAVSLTLAELADHSDILWMR